MCDFYLRHIYGIYLKNICFNLEYISSTPITEDLLLGLIVCEFLNIN